MSNRRSTRTTIESHDAFAFMARKHTLSEMQRLANERGGACLSDGYVDNKTPLRWRCSRGHEWTTKPTRVLAGRWCPKCTASLAKGNPIIVAGKRYLSVKQAADSCGLNYHAVDYRLKAGWSIDEAFGLTKATRQRTEKFRVDGLEFPSRIAAAKHFNIPPTIVSSRLRKGWSLEQALELHPRPKTPGARAVPIEVAGRRFVSRREAAIHFNIPESRFVGRLISGWTPEQAAGIEQPPRRRRDYKQFEEIDGVIFPKGNAGDYKLYLITNDATGKQYVGITLGSLEKRWGEHSSMGPRSIDSKLKRAIRRHGRERFRIELIRNDARSYKELMEQEKAEIALRGTYERGYNSTRGGELVFGARPFQVGDLVFPTLAGAAEFFGVEESVIRSRLDGLHWTAAQAVGLETKAPSKYAPRRVVVGDMEFPTQLEAARHFGIDPGRYSLRVTRYGWTPEQAVGLKPPPRGFAGVSKYVEVGGLKFRSIAQAARHFGADGQVTATRLKKGWTIEQSLGISPPPERVIAGSPVVVQGIQYRSIAEAARSFGLDERVPRERLKKGWTVDEAFGVVRREKPVARGRPTDVRGTRHPSLRAACNYYGIPYVTFKYRRRRGMTVEQALGLNLSDRD